MALTAEQISRMSQLLDQALVLDRAGRERWLDALAPQHQDLAKALRRALLADPHHDTGADDLSTLPAMGAPGGDEGSAEGLHSGDLIGPYRLLRALGSGGMAEVWLAERADGAFKREVALKVPMLSRLRRDLPRRFAHERDILARLEHPNIARLYDAGFSAQGVPYLAMEYVPGQPLNKWCDAHKLAVRERLKLFLQVLDAVQYAHARQVLHRDIKPSNILVTDAGQVRLLDFGVAKMLADDADHTHLTQTYGRALTPDYASPELLQGETVTVASDIYSLGVVMYELLAGSHPYTLPATAAEQHLEQVLTGSRMPRPSAQLTDHAADARATTIGKLARRLRGDLDAIVLKALAKAPEQRYPSASALADELQRHLAGEPIEARPGRAGDRLVVFLRRYWAGAAAAALALAAAVGLMLMQPHGADRAEPDPAADARPAAPVRDEKSIAVLPFVDMSEKGDQEYFSDGLSEELIDRLARSRDLKVIARTSSFQFKGRNEDVRAIAEKLGVAHLLEGSVRKSGSALRIAVQLIRASDGSHLWSQTYDRSFGDIFKVQDDIAGTVAQSLKVALIEEGGHGPASQTNTDAYSLLLQGNYLVERNTRPAMAKAIESYQEAIQLDPDYALAWAKLAIAYRTQAAYSWAPIAEAIGNARVAVKRALAINPNLALAHRIAGAIDRDIDWNWADAKDELDRARALDPSDLWARIQLAFLAGIRNGHFEEEISDLRQAVERNPLDTGALAHLGVTLYMSGQPEPAAQTYRKLLQLSPAHAGVHAWLGAALVLTGRGADALSAVQAEPDEASKFSVLPIVYWQLGQKAESDAALARLKKELARGSSYNVAEAHAYRGETDAALQWLERALAERDPAMPWVKVDPILANLHSDPRFQALLVRMKLAS